MDGKERLLERFESGRLVRPSADEPNFVDLVRALGRLAGVEGVAGAEGVERLCRQIGPAEHYVFVLIDGMGESLLDRAPAGGFLRTHRVGSLQAVFPSTTAAALTSLATCRWPCDHAVPGWWMYLPAFQLSAVTLPFVERFSGRSLVEFGLRSGDVFGVESVWGRAGRETLTVVKAELAESIFTRYASCQAERAGYGGLGEAVELAAGHASKADGPTFTYVYLPQLDNVCHRRGTGDGQVVELLAVLDGLLGRLRAQLPGRSRMVVSADHGLLDVPAERSFILEQAHPLIRALICPPTGEPRVPMFHVAAGCEEDFLERFAGLLGESFALIGLDEAEQLRLFGPGELTEPMRARLGDYVAVAIEPAAIYFRPAGQQAKVHKAAHAGLSRQEMIVPLIVA